MQRNQAGLACEAHYFYCLAVSGKLIAIKVLHTVIWVLLSAVVFYLLYGVITDHIDRWFWYDLGLIGAEVAVLLIFRLSCPLTVVARRYSHSTRANFDIYLPEWLARHNKTIYSLLMAVVLLVLAFRLFGP